MDLYLVVARDDVQGITYSTFVNAESAADARRKVRDDCAQWDEDDEILHTRKVSGQAAEI